MTKKIISLAVALALAATTITGLSLIFASATMSKPVLGGESGNVLVWDIADWTAYSDEAYRATKNEDGSVTFSTTEDEVIWNGLIGTDGIEVADGGLEAGIYYAKLVYKTSGSGDETIVKKLDGDTAAAIQLPNGNLYDFGEVDPALDGKWQSAVIPFEISDVSDTEMIFYNNWIGEYFQFTIGQYFVVSTTEDALTAEYEDDKATAKALIDVSGETPLLGWADTPWVAPGYAQIPGQAAETAWAFDLPALWTDAGGAGAFAQSSVITNPSDPNVGLLETKPGSAANAPIASARIGQKIQRGTYYLKFMLMGNEMDTVHNNPPSETGNQSNELLQVKLAYSSGGDSATAFDRALGRSDALTYSGEWQSIVVEFTLEHDWQPNIGELTINVKNGGTGSKHTVTISKYVFISTDPKELVREDFEGHGHVNEQPKFSSQPTSSAATSSAVEGDLPPKNAKFEYEYGQDTNWGQLGQGTFDDNGTPMPAGAELDGLTSEEASALRRERRIDDVTVWQNNDQKFTQNMITYSGVRSGKKYLKFVMAFDNLWDNPYAANQVTSLYELAYFRNETDRKAGRFGDLNIESEGKWQSIVMEIDFEADFPGEKKSPSEMNKEITFWFVALHGQSRTIKPADDPDDPLGVIPDTEQFHMYLLNHIVLSDDKTPLPVPEGRRDVFRGRNTASPIYIGSIEGEVIPKPPKKDDEVKDPDPIVYENGTKTNNNYAVTGRTPTISGLQAVVVLNEIELGFAQQLAYGVWDTFNVAEIVYMGLVNNAKGDDRELSSDGVVTVSVPIPDHALAYANKIRIMTYKYNYDYTATFQHLFEYGEGDLEYGDMIYENNANLIIPQLSEDGKNLIFKTHEAMTTEGLNYVLVVDDANYRRPGSGPNTGETIMIYVAIGVVILAIGGAVLLILLKKKTSK